MIEVNLLDAQGFEMMDIIVDVENCLQAYVGFASDINAIVVVFRGTQENSIQNWIEDLLWKQLDLDYPGMPEAMVSNVSFSIMSCNIGRPNSFCAPPHHRYTEDFILLIITQQCEMELSAVFRRLENCLEMFRSW
jgi:hypothetical protein